ncbi:hypothetical protein AtNW77_Chr4g0289481 [Arabidopsis thaliana]|uniref:Uncharacterized protein n=4 Tax=Arabidopsis TaxID=3701 RepID=A0A654FPE1_ARATH|nr:uncharacterized protein AT4G14810 [Arabidopsis thaliana]KAG7616009.1 hypothetical protein ISN45_At04g015350 [Arabidopsis thaliana x Arabidopsis arenosa]KAG7620496.1 hypothetical protein ISN44_As04g014940 [Arabidopsis suecica]AEE83503.1 hypothetical protein AT4G14810 [Arabidopsis thaliana]CAA0395267.1 unnamed protein product [Arabidopsis thaliana]VYS62711.1 unnamed protein product [Arabidopsis thaliana]|eukprot:NP_567444.1 hypothetical protein AT4G14810 [Arabidopsis thaliana]
MPDIHEETCSTAARKRIVIVIYPSITIHGAVDFEYSLTVDSVVRVKFRQKMFFLVVVLFFGGREDREVLANNGLRMVEHIGISVSE